RAASPALRVAAAQLEAAQGRLRQARLIQTNPVLSADLARHTEPGLPDDKDRGVQLEQEIEVGGQRGLRIAAAEHDVGHAEHRLATALGAEPGEPLSASVEDVALAPSPAEDALVARALDARPDLGAAREERARLETEVRLAARHGRIPNPALRGYYRQERLGEHIVGGGVSVPLPIFNR